MSKVTNSNYFIFIQGMKSRPKYLLGKAGVYYRKGHRLYTLERLCAQTPVGHQTPTRKWNEPLHPPPLTARVELTSVHCDPKYHFLERER